VKKRTAEMLAERRAFYEHEKEIDESKKRKRIRSTNGGMGGVGEGIQ